MQKISNQSHCARHGRHTRWSWPIGPKPGAKAGHPGSGSFARGNDGDTPTSGPEARGLRISRPLAGEAAAVPAALAPETHGPIASAPVTVREDGHRPHFPCLADPQDVADRLLERLDQEFAEAVGSGSRGAFAEKAKRRLADWKTGAGAGTSAEYREFRFQVHGKIASGLDAWATRDGIVEG